MKPGNLTTLLAGLARFEQRPAIIALGPEGPSTQTYAELARRVEALASGLVEAGLARGDAVALFAPESPPWITAALAIIRAGGAVLPVHAQLGDATLAHVLADSGTRLVFTRADRAERLVRLAPELRQVLLDEDQNIPRCWQALQAIRAVGLPPSQPAAPAALFYTSGTTVRP
jgi:long-chain acyl-CoA synthetase